MEGNVSIANVCIFWTRQRMNCSDKWSERNDGLSNVFWDMINISMVGFLIWLKLDNLQQILQRELFQRRSFYTAMWMDCYCIFEDWGREWCWLQQKSRLKVLYLLVYLDPYQICFKSSDSHAYLHISWRWHCVISNYAYIASVWRSCEPTVGW